MALTINNDTAIHEAGHCIISYMASDVFEIKFVTINQHLSRAQDPTSLGGLKAELIKDGELTFQEHDSVILMCLAGMAADVEKTVKLTTYFQFKLTTSFGVN